MAITGYPSTYKAPFTAAEIRFNQGPSTAGAGERYALYVAPMLSTASATAGTVYEIESEKDAIDNFGAGSPLHRAIRMHLTVNKNGKLYALPYAPSSGAGLVAAAGTIVVTAAPTASGTLNVWVAGDKIDVGFTTSSTATTIGDEIEAKINARTHLPVTASNAAGTVTLTAKIGGVSQGDATVGVIRYRATVDVGKGVSVAVSGAALGLGTGTAGVDGATSENANLTSALANIANRRFYYVGASAWSSTNLATLGTHISAKSDPNPGLRSCLWTGYNGAKAACAALAIARNYERQHIVWQLNSEHTPEELAAQVIALHQKYESDANRGVWAGSDNYRGTDWHLLPAYSSADWPDADDLNDMVTDGVTPIASDQVGSYLAMSVNTRSKDAAGTLDDFRSTERHRVSAIDYQIDRMLTRFRLTYGVGFKLRDDQKDSSGAVNVNQELPAGVLTPSLFKPWVLAQLTEAIDVDAIFQGSEWKDSLSVTIDPQNVSRLRTVTSGRTIDILHQAEFLVSETTPA